MLLSWVLATCKSYLAPSDSCGSQEQGVPLDLGRAGFTASAGGEKMDPGQKQHGWLLLMGRESWCGFFFFFNRWDFSGLQGWLR